MARDEEKASVDGGVHVDNVSKPTNVDDIDVDEEYTYEEQRKIIHRVDWRLVTICGLSYTVSLMDRTNTSVAAISGLVTPICDSVGHYFWC